MFGFKRQKAKQKKTKGEKQQERRKQKKYEDDDFRYYYEDLKRHGFNENFEEFDEGTELCILFNLNNSSHFS